jgi:hypothetical protein
VTYSHLVRFSNLSIHKLSSHGKPFHFHGIAEETLV